MTTRKDALKHAGSLTHAIIWRQARRTVRQKLSPLRV
jgi:hypothetical protein